MRHRPAAFTLLEVVGVVAVIGVAGALASFAMSDQVRQARAKADAKAVVLRLQSEHRDARERLQPLKISSGGDKVIVFQRARGPRCATTDGPATTATFEHASLVIGGGSACFNAHGEPDNAPVSHATAGATVGMAVTATLDDNAAYLVPIRVDRTGVHDDPARSVSKTEATAIEAVLATNPDELLKNVSGAGAGTITLEGT